MVFNIVNMNAPPKTGAGEKNEEDNSSDTESESEEHKQMNPSKPGESKGQGIKYIHPLNKFSRMLEDMIIEGDPFFLQKYRSIHNHELDTNLLAQEPLVKDKDVFRKGAFTTLPKSVLAA